MIITTLLHLLDGLNFIGSSKVIEFISTCMTIVLKIGSRFFGYEEVGIEERVRVGNFLPMLILWRWCSIILLHLYSTKTDLRFLKLVV